MDSLWEFFQVLFDSKEIINYGGLALVTLIVFAENGLFFAFFLPGDYLLFLTGLFCTTKAISVPIVLVILCIVLAAIIGSFVGYYFGKALGKTLETRPDSFFFKRRNLDKSRAFFAKYGGQALIFARFMPVVRTFSPIVAGTIQMPLGSFAAYNVIGGTIWGVTLPLAGYFLGQSFPQIINYVHYIILFFLAVTTIALVRTWISMRGRSDEG
jgi:membrane-associated protein